MGERDRFLLGNPQVSTSDFDTFTEANVRPSESTPDANYNCPRGVWITLPACSARTPIESYELD